MLPVETEGIQVPIINKVGSGQEAKPQPQYFPFSDFRTWLLP